MRDLRGIDVESDEHRRVDPAVRRRSLRLARRLVDGMLSLAVPVTRPVMTSLLRTKQYLLTGDRVPAKHAVGLGLANFVVPGLGAESQSHDTEDYRRVKDRLRRRAS